MTTYGSDEPGVKGRQQVDLAVRPECIGKPIQDLPHNGRDCDPVQTTTSRITMQRASYWTNATRFLRSDATRTCSGSRNRYTRNICQRPSSANGAARHNADIYATDLVRSILDFENRSGLSTPGYAFSRARISSFSSSIVASRVHICCRHDASRQQTCADGSVGRRHGRPAPGGPSRAHRAPGRAPAAPPDRRPSRIACRPCAVRSHPTAQARWHGRCRPGRGAHGREAHRVCRLGWTPVLGRQQSSAFHYRFSDDEAEI